MGFILDEEEEGSSNLSSSASRFLAIRRLFKKRSPAKSPKLVSGFAYIKQNSQTKIKKSEERLLVLQKSRNSKKKDAEISQLKQTRLAHKQFLVRAEKALEEEISRERISYTG